MRVKNLADPVEVEPPRSGEDAADCVACNTPDDAYIWVSERWRVRGMDRPTGLPIVLILECRSHLDIGDLPNLLAAELGVMTVRLERAMRSLDGVARVHVNRWGDGSAHLHMWFLARPYGRLQLRGTFLSLWDDILPVISEDLWLENLALVAAWLGEFGGRAIAEPPHIHWQSPSTFSNEPTAGADTTAAAGTWAADGVPDSESATARSGVMDVAAETRDLSAYAAQVAALAAADEAMSRGSSHPAAAPSKDASIGVTDSESETSEFANTEPAGNGTRITSDGDTAETEEGSDDVAVKDQAATDSGTDQAGSDPDQFASRAQHPDSETDSDSGANKRSAAIPLQYRPAGDGETDADKTAATAVPESR
ncbi:hypothetical protein AFR_42960 [Actinoplanes friuliensis DSM 7358]|uniref:Uncharacterized protein n=1 Tax=Actinoplanes friuliensis DSM 7358 TaxID=1246995 RepID=U5WFX2_9ACTN|nr:hypothetical protein AFR_42960 [Actinoplanes friuliensis DSM 7358]